MQKFFEKGGAKITFLKFYGLVEVCNPHCCFQVQLIFAVEDQNKYFVSYRHNQSDRKHFTLS